VKCKAASGSRHSSSATFRQGWCQSQRKPFSWLFFLKFQRIASILEDTQSCQLHNSSGEPGYAKKANSAASGHGINAAWHGM